ncbi:MAG TPA: hypothetical protein VNS60_12665 [Solirubrobacterales bacterium]|nr:hypothetical protein [Solirubrobacterales bacterium]
MCRSIQATAISAPLWGDTSAFDSHCAIPVMATPISSASPPINSTSHIGQKIKLAISTGVAHIHDPMLFFRVPIIAHYYYEILALFDPMG